METIIKKCCEKCYHDIENGVVFTTFQCEDCPCHLQESSRDYTPLQEPMEWESEFKRKFFVRDKDGDLMAISSPSCYPFYRNFIREQIKQAEERVREKCLKQIQCTQDIDGGVCDCCEMNYFRIDELKP